MVIGLSGCRVWHRTCWSCSKSIRLQKYILERRRKIVEHLDSCHLRCRTCMTYDIVRATYDIVLYIVREMSFMRYTGYRRTTSYVRHRTYVRCRTCTYDIVSDTYDIVSCHLNITYTMLYVLNGPTISYVHDIRYRRCISYTTSYVSYMTYDVGMWPETA